MSVVGSSEGSDEEDLGPDEQRCPECSDVIGAGYEFCPGCGGYVGHETASDDVDDDEEDQPGHRYGGVAWAGLLAGLASFQFLPAVLGPAGVLCGIHVYRNRSETVGLALVALGGAGAAIGWFLGPLV